MLRAIRSVSIDYCSVRCLSGKRANGVGLFANQMR